MKADEATRRQMTIETYGMKRVPRRRVVVRGQDRDTAELAAPGSQRVPVVVVGQGAFMRAYDAGDVCGAAGGTARVPGSEGNPVDAPGDDPGADWHAAGLVVCGWVLAVGLVLGGVLGWLLARAG